jgi:hypothetical protein
MKPHSKITVGILVITLVFSVIFSILITMPNAIAPNNASANYQNVTVHTNLTITHSKPDVMNVSVYEALNLSAKNITIKAGDFKSVICNATVRSWEGFNDINKVNATLYHVATSNTSANDSYDNHYTNVSCVYNSSLSTFIGWYVCSFNVIYYANNGSWICNVSVSNSYTQINSNFTGIGWGQTIFYPVYALNVTDGIDYGGVAVEDYSAPDKVANITNLGNMGINVSVEGYGVSRGDGLAMNCTLSGNITVANEKFSSLSGQTYVAKTSLTSNLGGIGIPSLTMPKQTNATLSLNSTYWQLYVPPNPAGNCTGYVIFTAAAP